MPLWPGLAALPRPGYSRGIGRERKKVKDEEGKVSEGQKRK